MCCIKRGTEKGAIQQCKTAWYQVRPRAPLTLRVTDTNASEGTQKQGQQSASLGILSQSLMICSRVVSELEAMCLSYLCGKCFRRNKKVEK